MFCRFGCWLVVAISSKGNTPNVMFSVSSGVGMGSFGKLFCGFSVKWTFVGWVRFRIFGNSISLKK